MNNQFDLNQISRREFMKLSGASLLALFTMKSPLVAHASSIFRQESSPALGRLVTNDVSVYEQPSLESKEVKTFYKDMVLPISKITMGSSEPTYNKVWYEMNGEGYVHSGYVQPVEINVNEVVTTIGGKRKLAEVTVPFTDAMWHPVLKKLVAYRLYYSTTHWVVGSMQDSEGVTWYEILEDAYQLTYYVNGKHLRFITADEVSTLSPDVPFKDKSIKVHLDEQIVIAYEGDTPVRMIRCSGGTQMANHSLTPAGNFTTYCKRPSRHMVNGSKATATTYDLPGVPWVCFINEDGVSFHGTYWHNDFGRPRSHGCINLPSEGAKWIYRWTLPPVPLETEMVYETTGTAVTISKA
jgi:hypothetical protein